MRRHAGERLALTVAAAVVGILLFFAGYKILQNYFTASGKMRTRFQSLLTDLYALDSELLRSSTFLYYNYDRIHQLTEALEKNTQSLMKDPSLQALEYRKTREALKRFHHNLHRFFDRTETFLTLNASLKNSAVYLPTLQLRAYRLFDPQTARDRNTLLLLSRINATLFLARNALDTDFLDDLRHYNKTLEDQLADYRGPRRQLLATLQSHLRQFLQVFPRYTRIMQELTHSGLMQELRHLNERFLQESKRELATIKHITMLFLLLYLSSLGVVIYFIFRTERENRALRLLKRQLEENLVTDQLTGLRNRRAFELEKGHFQRPVLILLNIDRFKQINEFYGTTLGDRVLQEVARHLESLLPRDLESRLYRIGGDEYGILIDNREGRDLRKLTCPFHHRLETLELLIDDLRVDLSFAIGASQEKDRLFETADMALKQAKSASRHQCEIYSEAIDKRAEIAQNIQTIRQIHEALDEDRLRPYYQPILPLVEDGAIKYEALARIVFPEEGHLLEPSSFIRIANEAKLGGRITLRILRETLRTAQAHPYHFSVNLTAADVASTEDRERIFQLLREHPDPARRITFEILESEEIQDYDTIQEFISQAKRYGCRIAIDDFGSGYSNFEKILKMDIDTLKIDGSLIMRIDHDLHSELIVKTILDFTRYAGIETVAEYVHSRSVLEKVRSLGIDYVQGFFIGKPSPRLLSEPPLPLPE